MARFQIMAGLLALLITVGCKAQTAPPQPSAQETALNRHVEVMVRAQFNVPQDYSITLGDRKPSQIPGYDSLPITLGHEGKKTVVDFLISSDNATLARLEKFDLAKNPVFNIDVTGRPIRGNPDAKVTIVNFDDLECPYCGRMHQAIFPSTFDRYKNKVRFIYKDDPLTEIHPWAEHAAIDANCLATQSGDVYWTYVDYLHGHGQEITGADRVTLKSYEALDRIARQEATLAKLDLGKLDACLTKQDSTAVRASTSEATILRIEGTPALFVNGERIDGAVSEDVLSMVIDRALRAEGVEPPPPSAPAPASPSTAAKPAGGGQ